MTCYARSLIFALALVGATSAAVSAAPDAGPDVAETAPDAGAVSEASDAGPSHDASPIPTNPAEADPVETGSDLYAAAKAGKWPAAVGLMILFAAAGARWSLKRWTRYGDGPIGRTLLTAGLTAAITAGTSLAGGLGFGWPLLVAAGVAAYVSIGRAKGVKAFAGRLAARFNGP